MHDTAYRIGGLVMDAYLPLAPARILEIGSRNVNGSLRDHAPRNSEYVGLDFEAGDGVDAVVTGLHDWNVPDGHFDFVVASSVLEHDKAFWLTFLQMCRKAQEGGYVYISAPSNGAVHRYPKDYWRFYPDAGLALEELARSEGLDLTLVESFVAEREGDMWNDFCAVFRRGPSQDELGCDFVHNKVRCTNALSWRSSLVVNAIENSEDARLLTRALEEARLATLRADEAQARVSDLTHELKLASTRLDALSEAANVVREELDRSDKQVADLTHELELASARLDDVTEEVSAAREELNRSHKCIDDLQREHASRVASLEQDHAASLTNAFDRLREADHRCQSREDKIAEQAKESAVMTVLLLESEQVCGQRKEMLEWLAEISMQLQAVPVWWGFMPLRGRKRYMHRKLRRSGLFDAHAYLALYPDVAAAKIDPLHHFIRLGMHEGRQLIR